MKLTVLIFPPLYRDMEMFQQDRQQMSSLLTDHRTLSVASDTQGSHTMDTVTTDDLKESVVSVCGVLLPLVDTCQKKVCLNSVKL